MYDVISGGRDRDSEMQVDSFLCIGVAVDHARKLAKQENDWLDLWAEGRWLGTVHQSGVIDWGPHVTEAEKEAAG